MGNPSDDRPFFAKRSLPEQRIRHHSLAEVGLHRCHYRRRLTKRARHHARRARHPASGFAHVSRRAIFLNSALSVIATFLFYRLATPTFARWPLALRCLLLTAIYAMLSESLFRRFLMDGVVSHAWRYCFVENLAPPIGYLITCCLIVLLATRLRSTSAILLAGIAIAAAMFFLINPCIDRFSDELVASIEYLDTGNIYNPPYNWQVNVPSYLTFLEPVLASFAIAASSGTSFPLGPSCAPCQWRLNITHLAALGTSPF